MQYIVFIDKIFIDKNEISLDTKHLILHII